MAQAENGFLLHPEKGYFQFHGVNIMAFDDIYPAGHQSGVSIIMHDRRIATNGDIRFEQTPGQWQPLPKQLERTLHKKENSIVTRLKFPDMDAHLTGFNPMIYPDDEIEYNVIVTGNGESVRVRVDFESPVPDEWIGKVCFNLELFPGFLFSKPWIMDDACGIFPRQPNGPTLSLPANIHHSKHLRPVKAPFASREQLMGENGKYSPIIADDIISLPYAEGRKFTVCPDDELSRFTVQTETGALKLYDGRMNHNNGWFVLSEEVQKGKTCGAIEWVITPSVVRTWRRAPVIQASQVGYMPNQNKVAVIETDARDAFDEEITFSILTASGFRPVAALKPNLWGDFLRYRYYTCDFSNIKESGLYRLEAGSSQSALFRISDDVFDRGVWQPVLEYFLPVQMCHMRVNEKYRVWHGLCHDDDAVMAPVNYNHIDGYVQGPSTLTKYKSGESVPGLNRGGWHDAGDFDLRIESQSGEMYILSLIYDRFHIYYDETTVDQENKAVEIHQPDGRNDLLEQIEHGALSVVGGYQALGRLYRGIICRDLRQYVLLGDSGNMTNNIPGDSDDRWVFTENNPARELMTAGHLALTSAALKGFNDSLSCDALSISKELYEITSIENDKNARISKIHAAAELLLATGEESYRKHIVSEKALIQSEIRRLGWIICRVLPHIKDADFTYAVETSLSEFAKSVPTLCAETPYGVPYRPAIWGAGWGIQRMAFEYFFLHDAYPDLFPPEPIMNALNFILGVHPGSNTASFASGVGAKSATTAYGLNRADFSYIPGGVISGTALIRPDFPELLTWPFLWQQTEYVMGGGSSHYMFLVLAVREILKQQA
ncbi:MAG: glycoside hydrolase family 9 protein [Clostridia bacterium]|nr:glycoside hydrolase family 9 protein [Clostridia bacterium]